MKLTKRYTNRTEIVAFNKSYHGSTQGALSIIGDEYWRNTFRPLLPGIQHLDYNSFEDLDFITESTACVIAETVQAEAGILAPGIDWIQALRSKCDETGALLVLDEIQAGFGRTGKLWGFQHFHIVPDILLLGKALGGGMPLGAFITSRDIMLHLSSNPVLGHITTFGGHPVSCAAGMAAFKVLIDEKLTEAVESKEKLFLEALPKGEFKSIRSFGLWMAIEFENQEQCKKVIDECIQNNVLTDWFLFAPNCLRISPPLTITNGEVERACNVILQAYKSQNN